MTTRSPITSTPLVCPLPDPARIDLAHDHYATPHGPLAFDRYRPAGVPGALPAVVLISGFPDPGLTAVLGAPLRAWAGYIGWAQLLAAAGLVAITYENRDPADVHALIAHLRAHAPALGLDPARIGGWACSGHAPTALAVLARDRLACAALLYGYLLDLDGETAVRDAAVAGYFAVPAVALDELPRVPLLVVRAGADATPGLDATLVRTVAAARARELPIRLLELPGAPHAFDLLDDRPQSRAAIAEVVDFLRATLAG